MLKINKLNVYVDDKEILSDFNLIISENETHVLMGPNGIGKSTICRTIMKDPNYLVRNGSITYNDVDLSNLTTTEISRLGIMMISQSPIAIEGVTNAECLRMALSQRLNQHIDIFKFSKEAKEICQKLQMPESFLHRDINSGMSGGERKKNELLHVWMLKPSFLILDEIDSGLDVDALKIVANSIKEYQCITKCSILLITHNPKLLDILKPDYVHIVNNKKIVKSGNINLVKLIEKEGFNSILKTNEVGNNINNE